MQISDELMWQYWELLTDKRAEDIAEMKRRIGVNELHPMDAKMELGQIIVSDLHSAADATIAAPLIFAADLWASSFQPVAYGPLSISGHLAPSQSLSPWRAGFPGLKLQPHTPCFRGTTR